MSKKKKDVMAKEREYFVHGMTDDNGNVVVEGCVRRGVPEAVAEQLFDDMTAFASYAFNKSHAAAYGVVAVQTGWLKKHYPVQFMAAIMNSVMSKNNRRLLTILDVLTDGVIVLFSYWFSAWLWLDAIKNFNGNMYLLIPKVRNCGYIPFFVTERKRSEAALIQAVQEAFVQGVSTRKMDKLAKSLGIENLSRSQVSEMTKGLNEQVQSLRERPLAGEAYPVLWVDALYEKVRYGGRVVNMLFGYFRRRKRPIGFVLQHCAALGR